MDEKLLLFVRQFGLKKDEELKIKLIENVKCIVQFALFLKDTIYLPLNDFMLSERPYLSNALNQMKI